MGEKLRITDQRWAVRGIGGVLEKIEDRESLQRYKENTFSTVHWTKLGANIEIGFRRAFDQQTLS